MSSELAATRHDLSVEYRVFHDGHTWLAGVVVLVDGRDLCAPRGPGEYIGLPPTELVRQTGLIEPSESPGEVRLCRCSCGEAGCGSAAARSYRHRDDVVWDMFAFGNPPPRNLAAPRPAEDAVVFAAGVYDRFVSHLRDLASRYPGW